MCSWAKRGGLLAAMLGGCLLTGSVWAQALPPLRIGLIAPLSGDGADHGQSVLQGAELAVAEINEVGGFNKRKLELVVRDDHSDAYQGRLAALDLVTQQRVTATVGFCSNDVATRSLNVFEQLKHVLLVPCAQGSALTRSTPAQQSFVFRVAPSDHLSAQFLVKEVVDRRKLSRVAILAEDSAAGQDAVKAFTTALGQRQLAPVIVARFAPGAASLHPQLDAARAAGADALITYAGSNDQVTAIKGRVALRWYVPYFAPWSLSFSSVLRQLGPRPLEGTMMAQSIIPDTASERRASFMARLSRLTTDRPLGSLMAAAQSYDAVQLLLRGLLQTPNDTSAVAIKRALENLQAPYPGVVTTYQQPFSAADHDGLPERAMVMGVWRSGQVLFSEPGDSLAAASSKRKSPS
jgi:branched-chain amino acid transport system substrate-binding protein